MLAGAGDWLAAYEKQFGAAPGPYSTQSYDAVRVAAEAITDADSTDGDKIVTALNGLKGFPVFSGPLTFTEQGTLSQGGFAIVSIGDDGTFVLKDDLQG